MWHRFHVPCTHTDPGGHQCPHDATLSSASATCEFQTESQPTNFRTSSEMIVGLAEVSYSPAHNLSSYSIVANSGADGRLRDRRRLGPRERLHDQVHSPPPARNGRPSLDTRQRHGYDMRWMETTQTMDLLWFRLRKYANPLIFVMDLAAAAATKYGR